MVQEDAKRGSVRMSWGASFAMLTVLAFISPLQAAQHLNEYQLKAAFIFNLAKFVEWPAEAFSSPSGALVACVLGKGEVEEILQQAAGRKVGNRPFVIRHISDAQEARGCHILFVNESVGRRWMSLGRNQSTGILTVGESDDFISEGGAVNLRLEEENIRIQINLDAARRAKLELSSKLLGLSEVLKR